MITLLLTSRGPPSRLSKQKYFSTKQWEPIAAVCGLRLKEASALGNNENDAMGTAKSKSAKSNWLIRLSLCQWRSETGVLGAATECPTKSPKRPSSPRRSSWRMSWGFDSQPKEGVFFAFPKYQSITTLEWNSPWIPPAPDAFGLIIFGSIWLCQDVKNGQISRS